MSNLFEIEVLLHTPSAISSYNDELELFIKQEAKLTDSTIDIKFVDELSNRTQIAISLVRQKLAPQDKEFYKSYEDNRVKFLSFYFQDLSIDMDEIDDDIYKRIEFKDDIKSYVGLHNEFKELKDLKEGIALNLKGSLSDILHRTSHSKINSSVISRSKGKKFYDHDNNLRKVDNFLRREKRISLINGLGGVGKTALAIEYGVQSLESGIYDYVVWLDVQNGINKEMQKFTINYLVSDVDDGKQGEEYYNKKFNSFLSEYPNSLVILDNYENKSSKDELSEFSKQYQKLDIIVTSREKIPTLQIHPIELDVFQHIDDALEMFILNSSRVYKEDEKRDLKELIEHLGRLPLALEITANFLSDSSMSVSVYLEEFKKESLKLFDRLDDYRPSSHLENLRATLKINETIINNEELLNILKIFALISPEPISKDIIENYLMEELGVSDFDRVMYLKELEKFSYIKKLSNNYSMHRLLQNAIRDEYFSSEGNNQVELITKLSLAIFHWFVDELDNAKYGSYFKQTKEHIDFILNKWGKLSIDETRVYLYTCITAYINNISENPKDTLESIKKAIDLSKIIAIKEDDKAIVNLQYARALRLNKQYIEAKQIYLNIMNLSKDDKILAGTLGSLSSVYDDMNEYTKALEFNYKSLELYKKNYCNNHLAISTSYNNLALIYENLKKYSKSEKLYKQSLDMDNDNLNMNHPSIAISYHNLGNLYAKWHKYPQSFKNHYLALKIRLNLELSPINIINIKKSFNEINGVKNSLKLDGNHKKAINNQIDELNKLFEDRKLKHKIKKLR